MIPRLLVLSTNFRNAEQQVIATFLSTTDVNSSTTVMDLYRAIAKSTKFFHLWIEWLQPRWYAVEP